LYQYRPDQPRIKDGKPVKYETPGGARMAFDVHPFAREMLGDPFVPLFITEGVKKGDAIVTHGYCAIALLGVWNWRGRNERGGLTALPEWEYVALNNGREVYIVFDSDIMLKLEVYRAMLRLKKFLEER
jgi:3'-phosphoadenosine 5'-phosphosulfate sulfotransferase